MVSNQERFRILSQPLVGNTDIQKVAGICKTKASEVIKAINQQVEAEGKIPHANKVSSKRVMTYFEIDINEVIFLAQKEIELVGLIPAGGTV